MCLLHQNRKTIDHCFLNSRMVKPVWLSFVPILSALLGIPFVPNTSMVSFYQFSCARQKNFHILLFLIKTILYGIWKFRNKATFHNGKKNSRAITRYIVQDIKNRIFLNKHRLNPNTFRDLGEHPALCSFREHDNLLFFL